MSKELVLLEQMDAGVSLLTLNRPDKRNALCIALLEQLCERIHEVEKDATQRVIVIRGAGKAFCAGLDMQEASDVTKAHHSALLVARMLNTIYRSPLVTIAMVHGSAVAGGAGLVSCCDLAVAAEGTLFGYPETRRGLVAGLVMTFLARQLHQRHVRELLLLGELIDARRALEIGLINRVVVDGNLLAQVMAMAASVSKGAPGATTHTKQLLDELDPNKVEIDLGRALEHHMEARTSDEAKEGMAAFFEKREPAWAALTGK